MNRGRSRQVSSTAIARRASNERRTLRSPSPSSSSSSSSMSPDEDCDEHPETLEDQVHIAYADDNIHLAKILLLRLKGIEVTGDNDPRIAEVQDEDFDYCFAPHGALVMDPCDERALLECQRIEIERQAERERVARLRMCEQKWALEKRRLREQRVSVLRTREMKQAEDVQRRQRKEQEDRAGLAQYDTRRDARLFQLKTRPRLDRQLVSYTRRAPQNSSDSDSEDDHTPFVYDFMITAPLSRSAPRRRQPTSPLAKSSTSGHSTAPLFDDSCSVAFADVLASMQGPLFLLTPEERARRTQSPAPSKPRSRSRSKGPGKGSQSLVRHRKQAEILQALLITPPSREDGRQWSQNAKRKGKAVAQPRVSTRACSGCSPSASSSELSSLSSSSRPGSWLSFGSSASVSSIATSPSSSPPRISSWFKTPSQATHRSSWLSTTIISPPSLIEKETSHDDARCSCHHDHLTPINITDSPLFFESHLEIAPITPSKPYATSLESVLDGIRNQPRKRTTSSLSVTIALLSNVSQSVSASITQLLEFANGFQHAYVAAAHDGDRWEEREVAYEYDEVKCVRVVVDGGLHDRADGKTKDTKTRTKPVGYRVSPKDVATFLESKSCCSCAAVSGSVEGGDGGDQMKGVVEECAHSRRLSAPVANKYFDIPLGSPYAPRQQAPSTVLPKVLPYKLYFKPIPVPSRCPFRFNAFSQVHTTYPEQEPIPDYRPHDPCYSGSVRGIQWRIRSVGNPVHLRLRALQNVLYQRGLGWEGRGRELSMGGGGDRVVGVAYEGIGCSKLSRGCSSLGTR